MSSHPECRSRRRFLKRSLSAAGSVAAVSALGPLALADENVKLPLLSPSDAMAEKVHYVEDAAKASGAAPKSNCGNCALYVGKYGSSEGPCQLFPGKEVKAAGWCSSWAPQM
ncbi:MAG TPA: high-potential iron-sulfur protein [Steroidobacteraceae bacterium]|nr:high-potential iron-sulfur protein [Steroidobacteraceae bacterium]